MLSCLRYVRQCYVIQCPIATAAAHLNAAGLYQRATVTVLITFNKVIANARMTRNFGQSRFGQEYNYVERLPSVGGVYSLTCTYGEAQSATMGFDRDEFGYDTKLSSYTANSILKFNQLNIRRQYPSVSDGNGVVTW